MNVLFSIVLPIFALVGAGWLVRYFKILGPSAAVELNLFVVYLGMPALLFRIMAKAQWPDLNQPGFIAAFGLGSAAIFGVTILARRAQGAPLPDASLDGLNAGYANVGFIGFPLCLAAFGPTSQAPVTITAILTVCILFGIAVMLVEIGLHPEGSLWAIGRKVLIRLAKNPMLISPVLGVLYTSVAPPMPEGLNRFVSLLGDAASPCALVSLGLFIADTSGKPNWRDLSALVSLKLIGQPAITWLLARYVFDLSPLLIGIAVVVAALPTGTGSFMMASLYRRDATVTAGSIMASTVFSVVTISILVTLFSV
jgi:predicted permease